MTPFTIHFEQAQFDDLRRRLDAARLPPDPAGLGRELGTNGDDLLPLLAYWRDEYDWRVREAELNRHPQYRCEIGGTTIHFFRIPARRRNAAPILLTHGWPDSFLRYAKIFDRLEDHDLVVPSLPGFAFSSLPPRGFASNADTAELWHALMTDVLGYRAYVASGGDMGRGVTAFLAARHPGEVLGIHLTDVGFAADLASAPDERLSPTGLDYKRRAAAWMRTEGAYIALQGTKPATLAWALADSPAGMAAWLYEKYRAWSDFPLLSRDDLCDAFTLYWMTNTAAMSIRAYHANSFTLPPLGKIAAPVAIAAFPHDVLPVPREWIERNYRVVRYTEMPRGGHFTALEQPREFAEDLAAFAESL